MHGIIFNEQCITFFSEKEFLFYDIFQSFVATTDSLDHQFVLNQDSISPQQQIYRHNPTNGWILVDETPAVIERPPTETCNKMEFQADEHFFYKYESNQFITRLSRKKCNYCFCNAMKIMELVNNRI